MKITPEQADQWAQDATDGPWEVEDRAPLMSGRSFIIRQEGVPGIRIQGTTYGHNGDPELLAAAPDLAQTVIDQAKRIEELEAQLAGMTEEWGVETKSHQFGLHWEWYDNEAAAKKAHGYQVDIWRARNRQKVMPIRRRFIMEETDND